VSESGHHDDVNPWQANHRLPVTRQNSLSPGAAQRQNFKLPRPGGRACAGPGVRKPQASTRHGHSGRGWRYRDRDGREVTVVFDLDDFKSLNSVSEKSK
jgi:hypothetical protein